MRQQHALERRRQHYRERRADKTTAEERRLQSEREPRRRRLLGESTEAKEGRLECKCLQRRQRQQWREVLRLGTLEREHQRLQEGRAAQQGQTREATLERERLRERRAAQQEQAREATLECECERLQERRAVLRRQAREATLERKCERLRERRAADCECKVGQEWVQSKLSTSMLGWLVSSTVVVMRASQD